MMCNRLESYLYFWLEFNKNQAKWATRAMIIDQSASELNQMKRFVCRLEEIASEKFLSVEQE